MNNLTSKWKNLPPGKKLLAVIVVNIALVVGLYFVAVFPLRQNIQQLNVQIDTLEKNYEDLYVYNMPEAEFEALEQRTQKKLLNLNNVLPTEMNRLDNITETNKFFDSNQLFISAMDLPDAEADNLVKEVEKLGLKTQVIKYGVYCTYQDFLTFLKKYYEQEKMYHVMVYKAKPDKVGNLEIALAVLHYSESPPNAATDKKGQNKEPAPSK